MSKSRNRRLTVSVAADLALKLYQKQQERELYKAYYANLSDAAKKEDTGWSELSKETAAQEWPVPSQIVCE